MLTGSAGSFGCSPSPRFRILARNLKREVAGREIYFYQLKKKKKNEGNERTLHSRLFRGAFPWRRRLPGSPGRPAAAMSTCGYHSPRFSEVAHRLPLPRYCLAPTMASAASALDGWRTPESFYKRSVAFLSGNPSQERQSATINAAGYSGFVLHLSGDEETAASTPISSNVLPFSLHLSSESAAESSPAEHNDNTQVPNSGTPKDPSEGSFLDGQEQEVNIVSQNQFEAKDPQPDNQTGVCKVTGKAISMPIDANKHRRHDVSGGKVDVRKLRNADVNDAIELSIAASEAMVIAEMILDDSQSDKLAAAAIEAALHVKEARKQFYCEETEHACGSSENDLDETDLLAELDEAEMVDVFQDVGLPLVHVSCSSQAYLAMKVSAARLLRANKMKAMKVPIARLLCAKRVKAMKVPLLWLLNANIVKERRKNLCIPQNLLGCKTWMERLIHLLCL
nr:unnamed protein product [Digitaria exilis]